MATLLTRDIKYLNRDFSDFRSSLIEFSQTYFPNTFNDFSQASPGMLFMEQSAYVGDDGLLRLRVIGSNNEIIDSGRGYDLEDLIDRLESHFGWKPIHPKENIESIMYRAGQASVIEYIKSITEEEI